jgi:hypothetical protein
MRVCENCGEIVVNEGPCASCQTVQPEEPAGISSEPSSNSGARDAGETLLGCFWGIGYMVFVIIYLISSYSTASALMMKTLIGLSLYVVIVIMVMRHGNRRIGVAMAISGGILGGLILLLASTCASLVGGY